MLSALAIAVAVRGDGSPGSVQDAQQRLGGAGHGNHRARGIHLHLRWRGAVRCGAALQVSLPVQNQFRAFFCVRTGGAFLLAVAQKYNAVYCAALTETQAGLYDMFLHCPGGVYVDHSQALNMYIASYSVKKSRGDRSSLSPESRYKSR